MKKTLVCVCVCVCVLWVSTVAEAETTVMWRGGAVTCVPKIDSGTGQPDILSALGYANVWPNPDTTGDSYADTYCEIPYFGGSVNEIVLFAFEGDYSGTERNTQITAYFLRCALATGLCSTRGTATSGPTTAPVYIDEPLDDTYYIPANGESISSYYMISIRLYDGNEGDAYIPRAYWVGLNYNDELDGLFEGSSIEFESEHYAYPECAGGCYGDCSFLSYPDDMFWDDVDWDREWRDYCLDPSLVDSSWDVGW